MTLPLRDVERHTYGEYLTLPEDDRYELGDGVAYAMAPAPTRAHQPLVGELYRQITDALDGGTYGRPLAREMQDRLASATCPQVEIDWERVVKGLP